MPYPEIYILSLKSRMRVCQSQRPGARKRGMYEPIKKMTKESELNNATESSCHHNFFVYLAKHL